MQDPVRLGNIIIVTHVSAWNTEIQMMLQDPVQHWYRPGQLSGNIVVTSAFTTWATPSSVTNICLIFSGVVRYYAWSSKFWRLEFKPHYSHSPSRKGTSVSFIILKIWFKEDFHTENTILNLCVLHWHCLVVPFIICSHESEPKWPRLTNNGLYHGDTVTVQQVTTTPSQTAARLIKLKWCWIQNNSLELNTLVSITVDCYPIVNSLVEGYFTNTRNITVWTHYHTDRAFCWLAHWSVEGGTYCYPIVN